MPELRMLEIQIRGENCSLSEGSFTVVIIEYIDLM